MSRVVACREMLDPERPAHQREHAQARYDADALRRDSIEKRNASLADKLVVATAAVISVGFALLDDHLAGVFAWW